MNWENESAQRLRNYELSTNRTMATTNEQSKNASRTMISNINPTHR
jgi:hypothetical protein